MLDARMRPLIDPPLNAAARVLAGWGVSANSLTLAALVLGLAGAAAIAQGYVMAGLALIVLNRIGDGLDGAVARLKGPSDFGGYLDITADFAFYVSIPVGFGVLDAANTLPALVLVATFVLTATSFLAYATIAAKRGEETTHHGQKSFFYTTGIAEGTEVFALFVTFTLVPEWFGVLAYIFAGLCILTIFQRTYLAARAFKDISAP